MSKEPSPLEVIRNTQQKVLLLKRDDVLSFDIAASAMLAAVAPKLLEPIWMYFIGPPSSGKTESISPYEICSFTEFVSTITDNYLASGYRDEQGNDPSALLTLNGKILVVKDVSPLLNDDSARVQKIWGDLRDAYDGQFSKGDGVNGLTTYNARFGVIMCATDSIDRFVETHQQLGERFLSLRVHRVPLPLKERSELCRRIREVMDEKNIWREHFRQTVKTQMTLAQKFVLGHPGLPKVDRGTESIVEDMANYLSLLRTAPIVGAVVSAELPSRLMQQLFTLGHAHALMDGRMEWDQSDLDVVRRIGLDTFQIKKRRIIQTLFNRGPRRPYSSPKYLMDYCLISKGDLKESMMQFEHMKALEKDIDNETQKIGGYRLTEDLYDMLDSTSFFKGNHMPG